MPRKPAPHPVLHGPQRVWKRPQWLLREGALDKAVESPIQEKHGRGMAAILRGVGLPSHMETRSHTHLYTEQRAPALHRAQNPDQSQDTAHNQYVACHMSTISSPASCPPWRWPAGGPQEPNTCRGEGRCVYHTCSSPSSSLYRERGEELAMSLRLKF